jgi:hypothetical protein
MALPRSRAPALGLPLGSQVPLSLIILFAPAVFFFGPRKKSSRCSSGNIARKLQAGALMPLYVKPGLDISKEVVDALNVAVNQKEGGAQELLPFSRGSQNRADLRSAAKQGRHSWTALTPPVLLFGGSAPA